MILYLLVIAFQAYCIVDVLRRGRGSLWIMALVFLPVASAVAYFGVEILPGLKEARRLLENISTAIRAWPKRKCTNGRCAS